MKTPFLALAGAAVCMLSLSSCVYDDYGYGGVGYGAPVGGFVNTNTYYGAGYGNYYGSPYSNYYGAGYGYGSGWGWGNPGFTSVSILGGGYGGYPYGGYGRHYSNYNRNYSSYRPRSGSRDYATQVARPSSFRGSVLGSSPRANIPSLPAPRSLPRASSPGPAPRMSVPSRSYSPPAPSGRASRPGVAATVRAPSSTANVSASLPAPRSRPR
jgi:hypothetical protein